MKVTKRTSRRETSVRMPVHCLHGMQYKCHPAVQAYLGGIEAQALEGLQKGLDGVIAGGKHVVRSGLVLVSLPRELRGWVCGACGITQFTNTALHPTCMAF